MVALGNTSKKGINSTHIPLKVFIIHFFFWKDNNIISEQLFICRIAQNHHDFNASVFFCVKIKVSVLQSS